VTNVKIADNTITNVKIADNTITNVKIADNTIDINKINDDFKNKIFFGYKYKGQYNADTNTPQLNDGDVNYFLGDYFDVTVAGIRQSVTYNIGDNIYYNGIIWLKKSFVF
jgi:hypothetical protein